MINPLSSVAKPRLNFVRKSAKNWSNKFIFLFAIVLLLSSNELWARGLKLGQPNYQGSGCPGGSVSLIVSPDESAVSVLFSSFVVEAGGETNKRLDDKTCNIAVPIEVPAGYSLSVATVDYRGYVFSPRQSIFNNMSVNYNWFGHPGRHYENKFPGPINENFTISQQIVSHMRQWSKCGQKGNLAITANLKTRTNPQNDSTILALDSLDGTGSASGLRFHVQWQPCH
jgi:hypothetical protein